MSAQGSSSESSSTELREQVALVVGGRGGIGAAVVRELRARGANVFVADVTAPSKSSPEELTIDVCSDESVEETFALVEASARVPDIVVFLAGAFEARPFLESDTALYEKLYRVNVFGGARVLRVAGARMQSRRSGALVVVASQSARVVRAGQAAYGSSKAALAYVTKSAALELAAFGIRANLVMPGVTETPMARAVWDAGTGSALAHIIGDLSRFRGPIPLGRVGQPEDVAVAVVFLASPAARHITMAELLVDGGSALLA